MAGALPNFPEPLHTASRQCIHLLDDMTCAIYDHRPDVCCIKPDTYSANAIACNELQVMTGTPASFRLPILDNR